MKSLPWGADSLKHKNVIKAVSKFHDYSQAAATAERFESAFFVNFLRDIIILIVI